MKEDLRPEIATMFRECFLAVLASGAADGSPYASLVAFAAGKRLDRLFFATLYGTRKHGNLVANPSVSLLIDDRRGTPDDFRLARALTAFGAAFPATGRALAAARETYLARLPHLRTFLDDPRCVLFSLEVSRYMLVDNFQRVRNYCPGGGG